LHVAFLGILDTWVGENTYNYFWFLEHYWSRLIWLWRLGPRDQFLFINKKIRDGLTNLGNQISTSVGGRSLKAKHNPLHDVYFPGSDFVPRTYDGRIAVFRVREQPRNRIRDPQLGWGKLARGGVDVRLIPGSHSSLLREPHVQGLAAGLKKYLLQYSKESK